MIDFVDFGFKGDRSSSREYARFYMEGSFGVGGLMGDERCLECGEV